jgi:hypothetical protein
MAIKMQERVAAQIEALFSRANSNNIIHQLSCKEIQQGINKDTSVFSLVQEWNFAPTIPFITKLKGLYEKFPRPIIIYGAGPVAKDALYELRILGLDATFFCDKDYQKQQLCIEGIKVISPEEFKKQHIGDYVVISSGRYMFEIFYQLRGFGMSTENIFIPPQEIIGSILNN